MFPLNRDWLRWRALATPNKLAVRCDGRSVGYAALDGQADRLAAGLAARGVRPGDKVATLVDNSVEAIAFIHAAARVGAVLAPLNTRLTAAERERQLRLAAPALVVVDDGGAAPGNGREEVGRPATPAGRGGKLELPDVAELAGLAEEGVATGRPEDAGPDEQPVLREAQVQSIIFTSGTTGSPKGVQLSFGNHFWSAVASAYRLGVDTEDRWLSCLPLYHVGGLAVVFRSCLYGTAVVLERGFDLDRFRRCLREERVTLTSLVPTMLHRLLHDVPAAEWPGSLRMVLLGGAAASPELLAAAREAGAPVAATYGMTETASQVATSLPADVLRKPGSVGRPLLFTELRIVDGDGETAPVGEIGEIAVRGPQVTAGYDSDPAATDSTLRGGWLYTGDMGLLDADGDVTVVQRRTDMIISGGENIYPAEVEAALREHSAVADVCVVGLPDAEWGQRCAAAVQLREGERVSPEALLAFSRTRLAGYKQPRAGFVRFVDALPQTGSGKTARREVEKMLKEIISEEREMHS